MRALVDLPVGTPEEIRAALPRLRAALSGAGPAVHPVDAVAGTSVQTAPQDDPHDPLAVAITTSGSTGDPKTVLLGASALIASASATHDRLGGPGHWLLALPARHVAGLQVLVRSLVARSTPTPVAPGADAATFAAACAGMPAGRRSAALVPAQLPRLLEDAAARRALAGFDAVLLGGAAAPAALLARARGAGVRVVTSYGMSETCGGCVYDGRPLDGVRVRLDTDARVWLAGPVLARGYLDGAAPFEVHDGLRWLRTQDSGRLVGGLLQIDGRLDDVLITGGVNVAPAAVEAVLHELDDVREAVVVGVPDARWGQRVVAVVVPEPGPQPDGEGLLTRARQRVTARLGAAAAPRQVVVLTELPLRGPGKPDRAAVLRLVLEHG